MYTLVTGDFRSAFYQNQSSKFAVQANEKRVSVGISPIERELGISKPAVVAEFDVVEVAEIVCVEFKQVRQDRGLRGGRRDEFDIRGLGLLVGGHRRFPGWCDCRSALSGLGDVNFCERRNNVPGTELKRGSSASSRLGSRHLNRPNGETGCVCLKVHVRCCCLRRDCLLKTNGRPRVQRQDVVQTRRSSRSRRKGLSIRFRSLRPARHSSLSSTTLIRTILSLPLRSRAGA